MKKIIDVIGDWFFLVIVGVQLVGLVIGMIVGPADHNNSCMNTRYVQTCEDE